MLCRLIFVGLQWGLYCCFSSIHAVPCYYYTNFSQLNVWTPAVGITERMLQTLQRNSPVKGSKNPALTHTTAKRKRTKALVSLLTCCNLSLFSDLKLVQPSYFFLFFSLCVFQLHKDNKMKHQCHPLFWRAARSQSLNSPVHSFIFTQRCRHMFLYMLYNPSKIG